MGHRREADLVHADRSAKELEDEAFLRQWTICEEDRFKFTSYPWCGEFRWFRSPNVVCLERYRRMKAHEQVERLDAS
jgi:hypothetical protein